MILLTGLGGVREIVIVPTLADVQTKHTIAWTLAPVRPTHAEVWRV